MASISDAIIRQSLFTADVRAVGHAIKACGPFTGHMVRTIALCENAEIAAVLVEALAKAAEASK